MTTKIPTIKEKDTKKYILDKYMLINQDEEEQELLTFEEAIAEKEQALLMQPENIYEIIDTETQEEVAEPKPDKIEIGVYYSLDENGNKLYDWDSMREEFDNKCLELKI